MAGTNGAHATSTGGGTAAEIAATTNVRQVIIVGSGPAGYTAAVYAARANLKPLVFEGAVTAGGALMNTTEVENYPGFSKGIQGPELMDEMRAQAERFGAELVTDDIEKVDLTGTVKTVTDAEGTVHAARTVILATGSHYRKLGIPDEDRLSGHGVSLCAAATSCARRRSCRSGPSPTRRSRWCGTARSPRCTARRSSARSRSPTP